MGRAKTAVSEENGIWAVPARKTTTPRYLQAFSLGYILAVIRVTVLGDTWATVSLTDVMHTFGAGRMLALPLLRRIETD